MYRWTTDSIRFRIDAAEQVRYDDAIVAQIVPQLSTDAHICDAGCGIGYTSLALARHCARVTAIDTSKEALSILRTNCFKDNITNIDVIEGDLFSMHPAQAYDAMLFCFFGHLEETLRVAKEQCSGTLFMVKKNWQRHRFTPGEVPLERFTFQRTLQELDALEIPYRAETVLLEMGQPFRSLQDAALFFETYRHEGDDTALSQERLKSLLLSKDSSAFPYFLPAKQTLGFIKVVVSDIP